MEFATRLGISAFPAPMDSPSRSTLVRRPARRACGMPLAAPSRAQHQLATLLAAGVRVALCTDNPTVSGTRLTREYDIARDLVDEASLDLIRCNALSARFHHQR
jgi:hypothetical protein